MYRDQITLSGHSVHSRGFGHAVFAAMLLFVSVSAHGHGSVVDEGDACLIRFGFYSAHFSIFQPRTQGHRAFCEDIPDASESVFVLEYRHRSLNDVPVDFRIMRNETGLGRFVRWDDLEAIGDLSPYTVFHQALPPQSDGVLTVLHTFDSPGQYIGVMTVPHPTGDNVYHAVFPFRVGRSLISWWPWAIAALAAVMLLVQHQRRSNPDGTTNRSQRSTV